MAPSTAPHAVQPTTARAQPGVALAVAGDVQHLGPRELSPSHHRRAPGRLDVVGLGALEVGQGVGPRARDDRDAHWTIATTRAGAALPPTTRSGKQETVKPSAGSSPRFTRRSIWQ